MKRIARILSLALFAAVPFAASAHEVYVLSAGEVSNNMGSFSLWQTAVDNAGSFATWAALGFIVVWGVFFISISRRLERLFDPFLFRLKRYGPAVARITIGLSFLAAAYYQAIFGPELTLAAVFGPAAPLVTALLVILGICFVFGLAVRPAALGALALFVTAAAEHGWYMLTYTNYLGEIVLLLFLGESVGTQKGRSMWHRLAERIRPYRFFILRVAFAVSLIYAALYAKVLHNDLALQVASQPLGHVHDLAYHFGFEPHFLVLGAAIIEILIGTFFLLGVEIRFTSLFMEFWLTLSLLYFGEAVWPHLMLIGIPIAFICHGYDRMSLEGRFFKKGRREPIL